MCRISLLTSRILKQPSLLHSCKSLVAFSLSLLALSISARSHKPLMSSLSSLRLHLLPRSMTSTQVLFPKMVTRSRRSQRPLRSTFTNATGNSLVSRLSSSSKSLWQLLAKAVTSFASSSSAFAFCTPASSFTSCLTSLCFCPTLLQRSTTSNEDVGHLASLLSKTLQGRIDSILALCECVLQD